MGGGAEFDRIRHILALLGDAAADAGDDVAIIPEAPGVLVASVDCAIDGVHFRRDWLTPEEIGWRAVAAALSDLGASGALPAGILLAFTLPADFPESELSAMVQGIASLARAHDAVIRGGNIATGPSLTITTTVFGRAARVVPRSGAQVGDEVFVTGALGGARAALSDWMRGVHPAPAARIAFGRPHPRLMAGAWLAAEGATAMIDVSDGLGGDAAHLAAASGVALEIALERVPIHPAVHPVASRAEVPAAVFAASGGDDYELLVTAPPGALDPAHAEPAAGVPLTRIGTVREGSGARFLLAGAPVEIRGFVHG